MNFTIPSLFTSSRRAFAIGSSVVAVALASGFANATECDGCFAYLMTPPLPDDPCFKLEWTMTFDDGSCGWDGPLCNAGAPCGIRVSWKVVEKQNAPSGCPTAGVFDYTVTEDGTQTQSGAVASDRIQNFTDTLTCDSDWVLEVTNSATSQTTGILTVVCAPCVAE